MGLSYKNLIDNNAIIDALISGESTKDVLKKKKTNLPKYIKGYADESAIESLSKSLGMDTPEFKQLFGIENKKLDAYDPYHTQDSKKEEFWKNDTGGDIDGRTVQLTVDDDTNTFKRSLYSQFGFRESDFWYEDPFIPSFELFFSEDSPLFTEVPNTKNCLNYFIQQYGTNQGTGENIDDQYTQRLILWKEFKNTFFKIFEKDLKNNKIRNIKNKPYYITKIAGLNNINKKIINYGTHGVTPDGDKITITMNEDVSMIAWYIAELYKNIVYSYKNQRYMFPENVIRFDMTIKINDMRNFQIPQSNNQSSPIVPVDKGYIENAKIKNIIAPKSQIVYTLHDCTFNFFDSKNFGDDIEIGGYGGNINYTPQTLSFDITYKSVTRYSNFPLIPSGTAQSEKNDTNASQKSLKINPWESSLYSYDAEEGTKHNYYDNLDRLAYEGQPETKGYVNQLIGKAAQTIVSAAINYADNLENKLRDVRGAAVNGLLEQFRNITTKNKIEPDNVYEADFNDRTSVKNLAKTVASGLINELESTVKGGANF